jgi:hypothetical protein
MIPLRQCFLFTVLRISVKIEDIDIFKNWVVLYELQTKTGLPQIRVVSRDVSMDGIQKWYIPLSEQVNLFLPFFHFWRS